MADGVEWHQYEHVGPDGRGPPARPMIGHAVWTVQYAGRPPASRSRFYRRRLLTSVAEQGDPREREGDGREKSGGRPHPRSTPHNDEAPSSPKARRSKSPERRPESSRLPRVLRIHLLDNRVGDRRHYCSSAAQEKNPPALRWQLRKNHEKSAANLVPNQGRARWEEEEEE